MKIYHNDTVLLDIAVDDNSYRYRAIKGEHSLTLYYALAEHIEIPIGAYCIFENETYTLEKPESFKMKHSRNFEYTVIFESPQAKAGKFKFRNPIDRRLKFNLTAKPREHLQMFVDNMNMRDSGWTIGECIEAPEKLISYNHLFCIDALAQQAETFETEYEVVGKRVSLRKVEYNKDNPLPLSYGKGNGFKPNIGRSNFEDGVAKEVLFVQGGTENIDPSTYGGSELLLPKNQTIRYDGVHFEDEEGFDASAARTYITDADGYSIRRADKTPTTNAEDSLDCSEIYPKRIGEVSSVVEVDADKHFYDIVDASIPANLNFEDYLIEGETMTVIFQSGMLAGGDKQFEVKYIHEAKDGKAARRFEIVPQEIDGVTMPGGNYLPQAGDTYAVFNCMLPDAYICDNATKSGASWDMFREGVRYLYEHEEVRFSFTGELDGIWAKKDWVNIGGRIKLGGYVRFTNEQFQPEPILVRIVGIKDYINNPHSPEIELSNSTVGGSTSTTLKALENNEVRMESLHKEAIQFTKRRYRDAKETMDMLGEALLENFTNSINPITVQTMAMLVGDESLQFQFVNNTTSPVAVAHNVVWDSEAKQLRCPAGIIQHLTLGIKSLSSSHAASEYKFWAMEAYTSAILSESNKRYYLYAKVSKTEKTGVFYMSEEAIAMEGVSGYYHLLMGVLNSEYEGERSYVSLYGFTEVMPGRITTDKVVSADGKSFFDMLNNALKLGDALDFNSQGDGRMRLKGTLVQSESGDESPVGCYRGVYNSAYTYYNGDEVAFTVAGITSTYRYTNANPTKGIDPTNAAYWQVQAAGVKGDQGIPGNDGKDGTSVAVSGNNITYQASNSGTAAPTGEWLASPPALQKGQFLWTKTVVTYTDGNATTAYSVSYYGTDGKNGEDGADGTSISIKSSSVLYAIEATGTQPADSAFTHSTIPAVQAGQYLWSLTKVVYSDGTETKCYGVFRIGEDGEQGAQGAAGADGKTSYLHIKYSNDGGQTFSSNVGLRMAGFKSLRLMGNGGFRFTDSNLGEVAGEWIGTYVDYEPMDSTDVFRYKWVKVKGEQGNAGDYYEYRYAKNGSTSTPPAIDKTAVAPAGWTTEQPSVGNLEYLWASVAKVSGDGERLLQEWSTPVRFTPQDGAKGEDGKSPALVFRGKYDSTAVYYGNANRVDAVYLPDTNAYYVARVDAGAFSGIPPVSTPAAGGTPVLNMQKWNTFGATFESVATNLLLAENANIAGWIYRNGRMESQTTDKNGNPMTYLNGEKGEVRLKGTIQHSTGTNGNYSDVDIFYLPAITSEKSIGMGCEIEDIGKVCRLFNSSPFGGANYKVACNEFEVSKDGFWSSTSIGGYSALVKPQEIVEMTCFAYKDEDDTAVYGRWEITSRFSQECFIQTNAKGRFPRALAIGRVGHNGSAATLSGYWYDGRSLGSVLSLTRSAAGVYKITMKNSGELLPSGCLIFCTGAHTAPRYGTISEQSTSGFTLTVSDDSSANEGYVNIMILDPYWWYNMQ